jgi:hypothetical protein
MKHSAITPKLIILTDSRINKNLYIQSIYDWSIAYKEFIIIKNKTIIGKLLMLTNKLTKLLKEL